MAARRFVPARSVRARPTGRARDVLRGDTVQVEVRKGAAHLEFEGRPKPPAAGETIAVCNPALEKRFRARVEGKGRVSVED